jgi:membrane dipeptidase
MRSSGSPSPWPSPAPRERGRAFDRRRFLRTGALAGAAALAGPLIDRGRYELAAATPSYSRRAVDLVRSTSVLDMLGLVTLDWARLRGWQRDPRRLRISDLRRLWASGVDVFHPAVELRAPDPYGASRRWLDGWNRLIAAHPDDLLRVDGTDDLERPYFERKIGILLGFQSSDHFRTAGDVFAFHALGQRISQLTYNGRNRLGDGCREPEDRGLTPFGAEVVAEMNRVGMAIDVSHCGDATSLDAIAASKKPVLVTHANCRALVRHPRCKPDSVLRAMAESGGVIGITLLPAFLAAKRPARIEHFVDHVDHVARLVGIEHVGLGSDSDLEGEDPRTHRQSPEYAVAGLRHGKLAYDVAAALLRHGYGADQVELVLGGNFIRALGEIWSTDPFVARQPPVTQPATVARPSARPPAPADAEERIEGPPPEPP